jgi:hypothetical protein
MSSITRLTLRLGGTALFAASLSKRLLGKTIKPYVTPPVSVRSLGQGLRFTINEVIHHDDVYAMALR